MPDFNDSRSKYLRQIQTVGADKVDVYAVLKAFDVRCPARQHAIEKLLCAGLRGKGDEVQDLREARDAVDRAYQMLQAELMDAAAKEVGVGITFEDLDVDIVNCHDAPAGATPCRDSVYPYCANWCPKCVHCIAGATRLPDACLACSAHQSSPPKGFTEYVVTPHWDAEAENRA